MKRILVPVDLSGATVKVCKAAAALAEAIDGQLVLVHVIPHPPAALLDYYPVIRGESDARVTRRMDALRTWMDRRCPGTRALVHDGPPARTILQTANFQQPDYIVIGSHGHGAAYDLVVGSTTHRIARQAPCPVLVVPIAPRVKRRPARNRIRKSFPQTSP